MEILMLRLQTTDLLATKKFYRQIMGFDIIEETTKSIAFQIGTSSLIFDLISSEETPKYHFACNIPNNQMNEAVAWIAQRANSIAKDEAIVHDFENWKAQATYFYDNNQNIVEFITREDLHNPSDQSFSIKSILNINEIGLVTEQPLEAGKEIVKKIKTVFFSKGPQRADFAAVGDDNGLLVISNPHRHWFPTQDTAEKWKVKAIVKVAGIEYELEFN